MIEREEQGGWWSYAVVVTWLRFLLVPSVAALAVVLGLTLPPESSGQSDVISMVPANAQAIGVEQREARRFAVPFGDDAVVV
jgi:hypothetical protein